MSIATHLEPTMKAPNLTIVGEVEAGHAHFDMADASVRDTLLDSQRRHFWFASRNAFILSQMNRIGLLAPACVLEVGCGTGIVLANLLKAGYIADGLEMHRVLAAKAAAACPRATVHCLEVVRDGLQSLNQTYRGIGLFDVLEHTDDPPSFLRALRPALDPDGIVFGTVPALNGLWSKLDDASGHQRRYDRASMAGDLRAAGMTPIVNGYFFQSLAPIIALQRRPYINGRSASQASRAEVFARCLAPPPGPLNTILSALCSVERVMHRRMAVLGRVPGASIFFAARVAPD